ncbi:MAG TPA: hypothetical protein VGI98_08845 [Candidatus Limnocylindrales bacterium]
MAHLHRTKVPLAVPIAALAALGALASRATSALLAKATPRHAAAR